MILFSFPLKIFSFPVTVFRSPFPMFKFPLTLLSREVGWTEVTKAYFTGTIDYTTALGFCDSTVIKVPIGSN